MHIWSGMPPIPKTERNYVPTGIVDVINAAVQKALQTGVSYKLDVEALKGNGDVIWITTQGEVVLDANQKIIGLRGTVQDITNRKLAEEKISQLNIQLKKRVDELQTLLETLPMGVCISEDKESKTMIANKFFEKLLGIAPGSNMSQSAPPGEKPNFKACLNGKEIPAEELPMQRAAATGEPIFNDEFDIVRADGRIINFHGHAAPLFDEQGHVRGSIGAFDDVTERKKAEKDLMENQRLLQSIIDGSDNAFYVKDLDGRFILINKHLEMLLGMKRDEVVGKKIMISSLLSWLIIIRCMIAKF